MCPIHCSITNYQQVKTGHYLSFCGPGVGCNILCLEHRPHRLLVKCWPCCILICSSTREGSALMLFRLLAGFISLQLDTEGPGCLLAAVWRLLSVLWGHPHFVTGGSPTMFQSQQGNSSERESASKMYYISVMWSWQWRPISLPYSIG